MASEQLERLQAAGFAVGDLPEEITGALGQLSTEEVDALISAREKIVAATAEVEGFAARYNLFEAYPKKYTGLSDAHLVTTGEDQAPGAGQLWPDPERPTIGFFLY